MEKIPRNGLKVLERVCEISINCSQKMYKRTHEYTREGIEAARIAYIAEGLKLLPDLIARVTSRTRM